MTDQPLEWLKEQPAATLILAAYLDREARLPKRPARRIESAEVPAVAAGETEPASDAAALVNEEENAEAWVPRVTSIEGIEPSTLSQLHGGLIARGLLKYELFGRHLGMRYRLTPEGRRAAEAVPAAAAESVAVAAEPAAFEAAA
jgi:hypothetical protein